MNSDRIKEIQEATAYPESRSVQQALLKVWNEVAVETSKKDIELKDVLHKLEFDHGYTPPGLDRYTLTWCAEHIKSIIAPVGSKFTS